jgi:large subunit ribosomal protein L25
MVGCPPDRTIPEALFRMSAAPARPKLAAERRTLTGKKVSQMRAAGRLPAVVFGRGLDSDSVSVDTHEFEQLRRHAGPNTLIDLSIDGASAAPVLVHGVQTHRVTRRPLHVDLYVVRMTEELTVDVALVSEGVSEAVENAGGTLLHVIDHVRVRALPDHLPESIHYSIESLRTFDDQIHVRDLRSRPMRRCSPTLTRSSPRCCRRASRRSRSSPRPPRARRVPRRRGRRRGRDACRRGRGRRRGLIAPRSPLLGSVGSPAHHVEHRQPQRHLVPRERRTPLAEPGRELVALLVRRVREQARLVEQRVEVDVALRRPTRGPARRCGRGRRVAGVGISASVALGRFEIAAAGVRLGRVEARVIEDLVGDAIGFVGTLRPLPGDPGEGAAGRSTRRISRSAAGRSSTSWSTNEEIARSKVPSSNGS